MCRVGWAAAVDGDQDGLEARRVAAARLHAQCPLQPTPLARQLSALLPARGNGPSTLTYYTKSLSYPIILLVSFLASQVCMQ